MNVSVYEYLENIHRMDESIGFARLSNDAVLSDDFMIKLDDVCKGLISSDELKEYIINKYKNKKDE